MEFESMTSAIPGYQYCGFEDFPFKPEFIFFSGYNLIIAQVVYITVMINQVFMSPLAIQIYDLSI